MEFLSIGRILWGISLVILSQSSYAKCEINVRIGSGGSAGMYHKFIETWSDFAGDGPVCIREVQSHGSVDNLELMKDGEIDFAIIQSDIGHHTYYGIREYQLYDDFVGIKPLFKEYLQIVYSGGHGELNSISELQGKKIAVDQKNSAGYWNARDLLNAAGMLEGFDFTFVSGDLHAVELLQKGLADVAFYTSAKVHPIILRDQENTYSFLSLPLRASKRLSVEMKNPYYDHGYLEFVRDDELIKISSVAVQAYLIGVKTETSEVIELVKLSLDEFMSKEREDQSKELEVEYIEGDIQDYPFKMHYLTTENWQGKLIAQASMLKVSWLIPFLSIALVLSVLFGALVLRGRKYTSTGLIKNESLYYRLRYRFINFSHYAIGFALWILWVWVVASIIVNQEGKFSDARNIESPLEGFGFIERIIWLIKSSFTSLPGEVPLSPIASILIPMTVLFGLGAFIYPAYLMLSVHQKRNAKKSRGEWDYRKVRDHTLICGWNERTKGVIYSILSEFAPINKKVVLIAEPKSIAPLDEGSFDKKRVFFVRGDPSDISVLLKAGAENASEAIIMASTDVDSKNVHGILSAVALRKLSDLKRESTMNNFFIGAELLHTENINAFDKAGASSTVNTIELADRMAALSLVSGGLSDFILDCLTYDDYFEIYEESLDNLPDSLIKEVLIEEEDHIDESTKRNSHFDVYKLRQMMISNDFQLLGCMLSNIDDTNKDSFSFLNRLDDQDRLTKKDKIVFFSEHKKKIQGNYHQRKSINQVLLPKLNFETNNNKVLIIGDLTRSSRIKKLLGNKYDEVVFINTQSVLDSISEGDDDFENLLDSDLNAILILVGSNKLSLNQDNINSHLTLDMVSILIIKYLNDLKLKNSFNYRIVTETLDIGSRDILEMAGAQDVLLKNVLVERVLSKMIFNHGRMYDIVSHLMTLDDDVYLYSYDVDNESPFVGMAIKDAFFGKNNNYQVCGWWSSRHSNYLKKNTMGIAHHYVTATNSKYMKKAIKDNPYINVGDRLVFVRFDY